MIPHDYLPSGNGYKVRLLLTQLGIPFRRFEYDVTRGETCTPDFLGRINPNGRVPVLETDTGGVRHDPVLPGRGHAVLARR